MLRTSVLCFAQWLAAMPAASPMAAQLAVTRKDAIASWVPEMVLPATSKW